MCSRGFRGRPHVRPARPKHRFFVMVEIELCSAPNRVLKIMKTGANRGIPQDGTPSNRRSHRVGERRHGWLRSCIFLAAAFVGGFASGLAGFAMGFVVSGVWLHILTPVQTTTLIAGYGLLTQGYGVWKLRHSLTWKNIAPFVVGGFVVSRSEQCCLPTSIPLICAAVAAYF